MALLDIKVHSSGTRFNANVGGDIAGAFITEYTRQVLPELAARTPRDSGRTARSYSINRTTDGFILYSTPYAPFIRFAQGNRARALHTSSVAGLERRIASRKIPSIVNRAVRNAHA